MNKSSWHNFCSMELAQAIIGTQPVFLASFSQGGSVVDCKLIKFRR